MHTKMRIVMIMLSMCALAKTAFADGQSTLGNSAAGADAPDPSVVLPENLRVEADKCFAEGKVYFVWTLEPAPVKSDQSGRWRIPFFYVSRGDPQPFRIGYSLLIERSSTGEWVINDVRPLESSPTYSSAGRGAAEVSSVKLGSGVKCTAIIRLLDAATGKKNISNAIRIEIE